MRSRGRLFLVGVLCVGVTAAAQARDQLFGGDVVE
jgi:hypothetical protein